MAAQTDVPTDELTGRIIGCAYAVSNTLGHGFLEKVYENALAHELWKAGLDVVQQHRIIAYYDDVVVGESVADLFVERQVIVELKAAGSLDDFHLAQCLNYQGDRDADLPVDQLRQAKGRSAPYCLEWGNP